MPVRTGTALLGLVVATFGCSDFEEPSELSREQVLAVRATPAAVAPGGRAELDVLLAGPDGAIEDASLEWTMTDGPDGATLAEGEAAIDVAADAEEGVVRVELVAVMPSGRELTVRKSIAVGGEERPNPTMMQLSGDGAPLEGQLRAAPGQPVELEAVFDRTDEHRVSWFATVGEIELYRHNPAEWVAADEPAEGWLFAVGRDDAGGVTWMSLPIAVE